MNFTGVKFKAGVWLAYLGGRLIAAFNSKGAALAAIEVERRRKQK